MKRADVEETDEAFLARANLHFHLDDDQTRRWDECPREIVTWKNVLSSFVFDEFGPKGFVPRILMYMFILDADDADRIQIDIDELARRSGLHSKKRIQNALLVLEKSGWICRVGSDEVCFEPSLVERAKRIYEKLALAAGYRVESDDDCSHISTQSRDSVMARQTSLPSAEPRRTFEARTFFVRFDKTS